MQQLQWSVILLMCIGTVFSLNYEPCVTKNSATLDKVVVDGCEKVDVCIVKKGTNLTMHMSFTTSTDIPAVRNNVTTRIGDAQIPFITFEKDACQPQFGLDCPLAANTMYNYTAAIPILPLYPTLNTKVTYEITDDKNNTIVCFMQQVKIVD